MTSLHPLSFHRNDFSTCNFINRTDAYPVNDIKGKEISTNSLSFHWSPPSIGANLTIAYKLTCVPLLAGIPVHQSLLLPLAPTATMATVTKLFPGVPYNCRITTHNKYGSSRPSALSLSTFETSKSCALLHLTSSNAIPS